jgi:hypothetical protein
MSAGGALGVVNMVAHKQEGSRAKPIGILREDVMVM